eukprot:TRINITY_DN5247_c0_g1_i11.p1 TRINITY_DN5247_c0_g1~~TRINITY_DN5247_c0_g1_i11.p1  ORF type:complete len:382 (+),score=71.00 TRINITY_DN5247_c0_g1_i11:98-1243(+)
MSRNKVKGKNSGLGRALVKNQIKGRQNVSGEVIHIHTTDVSDRHESILDQSDFEALMQYVQDSGSKFDVQKESAVIITQESFMVEDVDPEMIEEMEKHWNDLVIPKRPPWTKDMTKEDLDMKERQSFLEWRQTLLELEENKQLLLTPFEKNIEVWRQLWRVVERSHLIITIVDGRSPLLFRSLDLENWVSSFPGKKNLMLINKADLLSPRQRRYWSDYFKKENITYLFFSARTEGTKNEIRKAVENTGDKSESSLQDPGISEKSSDEDRAGVSEDGEGISDDEGESEEEEVDSVPSTENIDSRSNERERTPKDGLVEKNVKAGDSEDEDIRLIDAEELLDILVKICTDIIREGVFYAGTTNCVSIPSIFMYYQVKVKIRLK